MSDTKNATKPGEERFTATGKSVTVIKRPPAPKPKTRRTPAFGKTNPPLRLMKVRLVQKIRPVQKIRLVHFWKSNPRVLSWRKAVPR